MGVFLGDMSETEEMRQLFDAVPGAFCLITADDEERVVFVNQEALKLFECDDSAQFMQLTGGRFRGMAAGEPFASLCDRINCASAEDEGDYHYLSFSIRGAKGHFVQAEGAAKLASIDGRKYWSLFFGDMRQRVISIESDAVTGLMGLHEFYEKAGALAADDRSRGVYSTRYPIFFNIANFEAYNRLHGIEAGDACLGHVAAVLRSHFPDGVVAHLAADSFVVLDPDGKRVFSRIEAACAEADAFIGNPRIHLKAGVFVANTPALHALESRDTVDLAKIACDSIKRSAETCWAVYTEEMGETIEARARVLDNFEEALNNGNIKVFAQPLIRSFSGKVCSVEALARWDTPQGERLSPDAFIPVLEETHLIHKLDLYVVEHVVRKLRLDMNAGNKVVPVAVNISRADFSLVDVFEEVDHLVSTYEIPRDYLRIEVTETAIAEHGELVQEAIGRFRANGYQVWIDDFGSGVSSLNVLKDYSVDGLKIDLMFLRHFSDNARIIVTSIVQMAKGLGIHTVAEGVETPEQVEFLRSIGCETLQGFYFGKAMPPDTLKARCDRMRLFPETRFEGQLYNRAGLVDIATEMPVAVVKFQDPHMEFLCESRAYRNVLKGLGSLDLEQTNKTLAASDYPLHDKFVAFIKKTIASGNRETMTYVDAGQCLRLYLEVVAEVGGVHLLRAELYNITHEGDAGSSQRFDQMLRSLALTYDGIYYLHVGADELEIVETMLPDVKVGQRIAGVEQTLAALAREVMHPDDLPRFLRFARIENLHALAEQSGRSEATNLFRVRHADGTFRWEVFDAVVLTRTAHKDILLCRRDDVMERQRDVSALLPAFASSFGIPLKAEHSGGDIRASLWQSHVDFSKTPVFWKDRERRFIGANRAFLDAFGLSSVSEIKGKTDDEMGWHADASVQVADELAVLEEGRAVREATVSCLMRGQMRTISVTKFPVYEGGRIVGLEGSFRTLTELEVQGEHDREALLANPDSGLPGYRSMLMTGLQFADSYRLNGEDYLMALIDVPEFDRTCALYGETFRRDLFARIYQEVKRICVAGGALAHIGSCCFAYLQKRTDDAELRERVLDIAGDVHAITEVDGCSCTLYLQYAVGNGSESRSFDGLIRLLVERLNESREQSYGRELLVGDRLLFDCEKFDNMNDRVGMWDPDTYEILYLNKAYLRDLHLPEDYSFAGRKCYELVEGYNEPCPFCRKGQLRVDRFDTRLHRKQVSGVEYLSRNTLVSWRGKNRIFNISIDLSSYIARDIDRNDFIFREASANDAIAVGMQEVDPSMGVQKFIERVGQILGAERFYVFEEAGDGTVSGTFEWKRNDSALDLLPELQHIPLSEVRALLDRFDDGPVTLIEDIQQFEREHESFVVHVLGARSIVAGHLNLSNGLSGYAFVVNPSPDTFRTASLLLTTLTRFLEVMLRNRDIVGHLNALGVTDQLTGVMNRRALLEHIEHLEDGHEIGIIFGDINGLKAVNDKRGHREGDKLIRSVAQVMSGLVGAERVFRTGGDEFLMIVDHVEGRDLEDMVSKLREEFAAHGASVALGYARFSTPLENADTAISKVDHLMYKDKGAHYYGRRSTDR